MKESGSVVRSTPCEPISDRLFRRFLELSAKVQKIDETVILYCVVGNLPVIFSDLNGDQLEQLQAN